MSVSVVVFTRDLRVRDHPALVAACAAEHVVPLFVVDDRLAHGPDVCANRLHFLIDSLEDLDVSLRDRGAALVVRRGRWVDEVARVVADCGSSVVHCSDDVSSYAKGRLDRLRRVGARQGFEVVAHPGITVVPPGALMITGSGTPYQVHTLLSPLDRGDVASAGSGTEATLVAGTHRPGVHADVGGTHQRGAVTRAAGGR